MITPDERRFQVAFPQDVNEKFKRTFPQGISELDSSNIKRMIYAINEELKKSPYAIRISSYQVHPATGRSAFSLCAVRAESKEYALVTFMRNNDVAFILSTRSSVLSVIKKAMNQWFDDELQYRESLK